MEEPDGSSGSLGTGLVSLLLAAPPYPQPGLAGKGGMEVASSLSLSVPPWCMSTPCDPPVSHEG